MSHLPVSRHEVRRVYADLADDVSAREQALADVLPVDAAAGLSDSLWEVVDNWESGRKSLRTVPACNVYACHSEQPLGDGLIRTLTGLDATINLYDDIIDTRELSTRSKVALTVNAALAGVLTTDGCPPAAKPAVTEALFDYFTTVFQIPPVERELLGEMATVDSQRERRAAAERFYAYRSRDIDALARIPAAVLDVDDGAAQRLLEDLRTYRCRRLLFKDIRDVERHLADGDTTPVLHLLQTADQTSDVVEAIEDLYARFTYSTSGQVVYGDVLMQLESPPEDLGNTVRQARESVLEPAR
ncbi:MAG: hypothetical protein ABEJ79_11445 [Halolamina sp.]